MKHVLAAAAAAVALAASGSALAQTSGSVSLQYANGDLAIDHHNTALLATVSTTIADRWMVQVDGRIDRSDYLREATSGELTVHLGAAVSDRARLGVFVGAFTAEENLPFAAEENDNGAGGGVEGSFTASPDVTIGVAVGAARLDPRFTFYPQMTLVAGRIDGHWLVGDNTRIDGSVHTGQVSFENSYEHRLTTVGLGVEHQFNSQPISIYAGYEYTWAGFISNDRDGGTARIGVRWNFGGGTLRSRPVPMANFGDVLGGGEAGRLLMGVGAGMYD